MNLARREPRWAVTFTLLLALIAQVIPLPDWLSVVRPAFVALVIIYWSIYAPHAGGIFAPWLAGLALDVFKGDVLAQNALAVSLVAYIAMSLHQRLRNEQIGRGNTLDRSRLGPSRNVGHPIGTVAWTGRCGKNADAPVSHPSNSTPATFTVSTRRGSINGSESGYAIPGKHVVAEVTPDARSQPSNAGFVTPLG